MNPAMRIALTRQTIRRLMWQARAAVIREQLIALRETRP